MRPAWPGLIGIVALGAVLATGCSGTVPSTGPTEEPLRKEPIEGTDLTRLILSSRAIERLDVRSVAVEGEGGRLLIPAGAVLVDATGSFWVYTRPQPRVFVRHRVDVDRFVGEVAVLHAGPPAGTEVVTLGAAELHGAEFGIGK